MVLAASSACCSYGQIDIQKLKISAAPPLPSRRGGAKPQPGPGAEGYEVMELAPHPHTMIANEPLPPAPRQAYMNSTEMAALAPAAGAAAAAAPRPVEPSDQLTIKALYGHEDSPVKKQVVLVLTGTVLTVFDMETKQKTHKFPIDCLRAYGQKGSRLKLEAGRRCEGGAGIHRYDLLAKNVNLAEIMRSHMKGNTDARK